MPDQRINVLINRLPRGEVPYTQEPSRLMQKLMREMTKTKEVPTIAFKVGEGRDRGSALFDGDRRVLVVVYDSDGTQFVIRLGAEDLRYAYVNGLFVAVSQWQVSQLREWEKMFKPFMPGAS